MTPIQTPVDTNAFENTFFPIGTMLQKNNEPVKTGPIGEIRYYLKTSKKYWLLPIILLFALFSVLIFVSEVVPVVSPFIYTLF
jgi:hypothetical protein